MRVNLHLHFTFGRFSPSARRENVSDRPFLDFRESRFQRKSNDTFRRRRKPHHPARACTLARIRGDHDRARGRRRRHRPGHHVHLRRGVAERTVRARKPPRSHDPFRDLSFFPRAPPPFHHAARLTPPRSRPRDAQRRDHRERSRQPHDPFLRRLHGHREARRRRREEPGARVFRFWDATILFVFFSSERRRFSRSPADRSGAVRVSTPHRETRRSR